MRKPSPPSRSQDLLGAALGLFCVVMLAISPWQIDLDVPYSFYAGPLLVPMLVLAMGALASLPFWKRLLFPEAGASWYLDGKGSPTKPAVMLLLGALYPVLLLYLGLEAATFLILGGELRYLGRSRPRVLLAVTAVVTLAFWLVFKVALDVYFPPPRLWETISESLHA
jgi:amino acid transporter